MASSATMGGTNSGAVVGWEGSLEEIPLAEVFRRIAVEERSGDLQVSSPSATKTVYFDQGFVVFASSSLKDDRLGESMIEAGRISRHEFAQASRLMQGGKRKFGQALVEAGIVSEEELGRHVAGQVNRIVLSLFSLKEGKYNFEERPCSIPIELMVSLSVYRILIDGIRRMSRKKLVLAGLPPFDTKLRIVEAPPFTLDFYKLRSEERAVLRMVREGKTLQEIPRAVGGNEGVVFRGCYALYAAGVVEAVTPAGTQSRPRRVQEETGTFVLSEIRRKVAKKPEGADAAVTPAVPAAPVLEIPEPAAPVLEIPEPAAPEPEIPEPAAPEPEVREPETPEPIPEEIRRSAAERARAYATDAEVLQETAGKGWSFSELVSDAVRFLKLSIWNRLVGLAFRLFPREPEAPEPPPHGSLPAEPAKLQTDVQVPKQSVVPQTWSQGPARASSQEAKDEELVMEIIGIPSWSTKDDPNALIAPDSLEEEPKEEPVDDNLGVPKWSMRDGPYDRSEPSMEFIEDDPIRDSVVEEVGSPSWSILDRSVDSEEETSISRETEEPQAREALPEIELELDEPAVVEPTTLDSDLFVEGEGGGEEQPSMLHHIPVEEIKHEDSQEIEFEIEEGVITDLPEPAEEPPPPPSDETEPESVEPEEQVGEMTAAPQPSPHRPISSREEEAGKGEAVSPDDRSMRAHRMKIAGGEAALVRDVKLHFQYRDWEGAVRLLEDLVQVSPGSAFYRGLLARAMSRHPALRDGAEKHFIEALRLSPQDAQLHYWLGLYYKSYGLKSRAFNEFRTTLRIDPKHKGARKQFTDNGGKRGEALGAVLKKFFT